MVTKDVGENVIRAVLRVHFVFISALEMDRSRGNMRRGRVIVKPTDQKWTITRSVKVDSDLSVHFINKSNKVSALFFLLVEAVLLKRSSSYSTGVR